MGLSQIKDTPPPPSPPEKESTGWFADNAAKHDSHIFCSSAAMWGLRPNCVKWTGLWKFHFCDTTGRPSQFTGGAVCVCVCGFPGITEVGTPFSHNRELGISLSQ